MHLNPDWYSLGQIVWRFDIKGYRKPKTRLTISLFAVLRIKNEQAIRN